MNKWRNPRRPVRSKYSTASHWRPFMSSLERGSKAWFNGTKTLDCDDYAADLDTVTFVKIKLLISLGPGIQISTERSLETMHDTPVISGNFPR